MQPALSVISFTTLLGASQGLIVCLAILRLTGTEVVYLPILLLIACALLIASLAFSFLHLGHPERAWRAAAMWRTSWLSREVIVLPVFIGLTALWALLEWTQAATPTRVALLTALLIAMSFLLWHCTAMIYACLKFIQEWAHPLTLVNYTLIGIASGAVLCAGLMTVFHTNTALAFVLAPWAAFATALALVTRWASFQRNAQIKPLSTLQSATGIHNPKLRQVSMGMSAGSFNTREFFHGKTILFVRNAKSLAIGLGFLAPIGLLLAGSALESLALIALAFPVQYLGLLCERWVFFAQASHPQNLYYQTVS
jgi:sulfite dehydrogenase (quinone) subunit SoeC